MTFVNQIKKNANRLWHIARVKQLVRDSLPAGPMTLITVAQIECPDETCPGPATQITIQGPDALGHVITIHLAIEDVTSADLAAVQLK